MSRTLSYAPCSIGIGSPLLQATVGAARAADTFQFADVAGWWSAEPQYGGESSRVAAAFPRRERQAGRAHIPARDRRLRRADRHRHDRRHDARHEAVSVPAALRSAKRARCSGFLAEEAVPVYKIPVEFRRIEPLAKPAPRTWDFPRPRVRWTFDTGAAVWAGIERDARRAA